MSRTQHHPYGADHSHFGANRDEGILVYEN